MNDYLPQRYSTIFQRVFTTTSTSSSASASAPTTILRDMVTDNTIPTTPPSDAEEALAIIGRQVEEDFLFLLPPQPSSLRDNDKQEGTNKQMTLEAFIGCFPNGFNWADKSRKSLASIHVPVPDYTTKSRASMDRKFWHQILRIKFTAISNYITRDVFGLAISSFLERYTNVFCVFPLSGILHLASDVVRNKPMRESGAMVFFLSFVLGYMVEDGVQAVWRKRFQDSSTSEASSTNSQKEPEIWKKVLGYIWVLAFLAVTSAVYFEPVRKSPERQLALVPWSFVEVIGLEMTGVLVVG
ncbi:hypothetical protein BO83DRAFT_388228 [Aspergillus eucalypticola CBS 122712]|uniref:Uncharacterized protein n=1 Tax=Aspergillus eucalypticola (strain CBS 122712 / IBT 29274) TaxID=1448314 RepID=A0A317VKV0_ASPEC|nr:uncharacterized protein BO83DRAFT_388228 [Aspergillus eucalypticola CBS 122712]PWY74916.1 hypothetical protein BO83DRAFT_388228 [Aspergillus eucalypticola CBS 122712]